MFDVNMAQPCGAWTARQSIDVGNAQSNAGIWRLRSDRSLGAELCNALVARTASVMKTEEKDV
jgi:hypothetical protein